MPQSREHLDIINLLQIQQGIFVITKTDLADEEWLLLVEEDIRALLSDTPFKNAPVLKTSAAKGEGISELHNLLLKTLAQIPARQDYEVYRQPVDRVFSAKGFGTVITGTVLSGKLAVGEDIEIQPTGLKARVRGLQSHDQDVNEVQVGYRSAVNLAGIDLSTVERGMVFTQPDLFSPVTIINARVSILKSSPIPLKNNQRIRLHIHTAEAFARALIPHAPQLKPGESAYIQLRLEQPVHAAFQDRFIIRQYSPQRTIGGGVVLQANPFRYRKKYQEIFGEALRRLESEEPQDRILAAFDILKSTPLKLWELKTATNLPLVVLQKQIKEMQSANLLFSDSIGGKTAYFSGEQLSEISGRIEKILTQYHQTYPGRPGQSDTEIISQLEKFYIAEAVRKSLQWGIKKKQFAADGKQFRLATFTPQLSAKDSEVYHALENWYREAQYAPPTHKEAMAKFNLSQKEFRELTKLLRDEKKLVYADETLLFHSSVFPKLKQQLQDYFRNKTEISVAEF